MVYSMLFSPITINGMTLKNRIVMTTGGCSAAGGHEDGYISAPQADFLARRAQGGVGMVYIGVTGGDMPSRFFMVRLTHEKYLPSFQRVVERIHEGGAKVCVQLINWLGIGQNGLPAPEEVSLEDMKRVKESTALTAARARKAGVDAFDFHFTHSVTMARFLSRHWNRRTDEYSGNTEGRMKYPIEVYQAVRDSVGSGIPIAVRIDADEFLPDGNTLTHSRIIARKFAELGINYLNHSAGFITARGSTAKSYYPSIKYDSNPGMPYCAFRTHPVAWMPDGVNVYLGEDLRKTIRKAGYTIPVMTAGKIPHPKFAEEILQEGKADLIGLLRPLMRDPDWAMKAKEGREKEIKRCRYCNQCLAHKTGEQSLCVYYKM